nr:MAG TPA: RuvB AAA lid domain [Caudoviricetes sp.]
MQNLCHVFNLTQSRVIETQSCRITRLSRSVPRLVNLLCLRKERRVLILPLKKNDYTEK